MRGPPAPGHDVPVSAEDIEAYENDLELDLYREYRRLHDHFGTGGNDVMHCLKARRREILVTKSAG